MNEEIQFKCDYCGHFFQHKKGLLYHQKTAKYCLTKRDVAIPAINFSCEHCQKSFTQKHVLQKHQTKCFDRYVMEKAKEITDKLTKENLQLLENKKLFDIQLEIQEKLLQDKEKTIQNKDDQIRELQNKLENIAIKGVQKSTVTNNTMNTVLAPFNLTEEKAKEIFESKFNENYFLQGQKGVARFLKDHVLKTDNGQLIYACYDPARKVFKYTGENGKQIKDIHAYTLSGIIYPSAVEESKKINNKFAEEYFRICGSSDRNIEDNVDYQTRLGNAEIMLNKATDANIEITKLKTDNSIFAGELASLTT